MHITNIQRLVEGYYFSLVVLCYKGEQNVVPFVERVHRLLSQYSFNWEIILVANYLESSNDKTPEVAEELSKRLAHVRFVAAPKEGMMGWDMRSGMDVAKGKYVGVIDGDGQFPEEAIASCLAKIELEDLDLVKTYRVQRNDGPYRRLISFVYNYVFQLLFGKGIRDANSKPKILRRSKYLELDLKSDDWFIDAEIMIRAREKGWKVGEIPTHFYAHSHRLSFVKPKAIFEFISNLIRYRYTPIESSSEEVKNG